MFLSDSDFFRFIAVCVGIGVALGAALFIGLPWLWGVLKPLLHLVTG